MRRVTTALVSAAVVAIQSALAAMDRLAVATADLCTYGGKVTLTMRSMRFRVSPWRRMPGGGAALPLPHSQVSTHKRSPGGGEDYG